MFVFLFFNNCLKYYEKYAYILCQTFFRVIKEKLIHLSNLTRSTTPKDVNEYIENSCNPEYFKTETNSENQTSQSNEDEIMWVIYYFKNYNILYATLFIAPFIIYIPRTKDFLGFFWPVFFLLVFVLAEMKARTKKPKKETCNLESL